MTTATRFNPPPLSRVDRVARQLIGQSAISIGLALPVAALAGGPIFTDLAAGANDARIAALNPAGMTRLDESSWRAAVIASYSESTWEVTASGLNQSTTTDTDSTLLIPALFYARPLGDRWAIGASLAATSGVGDDGDEDSISRYLSTEWSLGSFTFQPAIAYRLTDAWSVGGAVGVNYTAYKWEAAVFNGIGQPDGKVEVSPDDIALNYIVSLHWALTERTRFGISYRSEYNPSLKDTPDYSGVDPARQSDEDIELEVTIPQSVLAGIYHGFDNGHWLSLDLLWIETSKFNIESAVVDDQGRFVIDPFKLNDTWIVTAGWGMPIGTRWDIGLGALYLHDPLDDENRSVLLRVDSAWGLGASIEYAWDSGTTVGANLSYLFTGDSPVETPNLPVVGTIRGEYTDTTNWLGEIFVSW